MSETIGCDLLILGSGMAGLTAGARAAEQGAKVVVVEKDVRYGGSAALSGGVLYAVLSPRKMAYFSDGDPALAQVVIDTYPEALEWLRGRGVGLAPSMPVLQGRGYRSDILGHLDACVATIEGAGGHIALESQAVELLPREGGGVAGAVVRHADGDIVIEAPWTLLATGGYQGSPELREKYIHPNARDMRLRANTASDGGGLRLGQSVGGHVSGDNPGFYGHLVSDTPDWGDPRLYVPLTQYQSDRGLLINERGERFCDENALDHVNTQRVLAQPNGRALLVWDERLQRTHVVRSFVPDAPVIDRLAVALARGGQGGSFGTLEELAAFASAQGFDGEQARRTIKAFNEDARTGWEKIDPPRADTLDTVEEAPFHALVVYPAITFTHGGLSVDTQARVLDEDRNPIPGLLAAGADAGDVYKIGYAGGLSLAMTFGIRAARTAGFA